MNRLKLAGMMTVCILTMAGCTLHTPQEAELPAPVPETFQASKTPNVPVCLADRWWHCFDDARLNELMQTVFERNLDLAQAYARLEQFQAILSKNAAVEKPYISLEGQAERSKEMAAFFGGFTGNSYRLSLAAGYEIDIWKKFRSRTRSSRFEADASLEDIKTLYLTLSADVADLYYYIVEQRAQIELTDRTIASYTDTLERVKRRYREGVVSAVDVYQAMQNLSAAKSRRPGFESGLAAAEHALSVLTGRFPDRSIAGDLAVLPQIPDAFPAGLPSEVLLNRPDIQAELLRLKAGDEDIAAAVADRFPSFNLLAHYGTAGTDYGNGTLSGSVWDIIGNMTLPLLDWGNRKAEVTRTRAVYRERLYRYQQQVLEAFQEVEDALVSNRTAETRIARLEEREIATSASLRLSTDRYMMGLTDYLPVLTSQIFHFDTQSQLLASRRQLVSDRISLARALGGTWMQTDIQHRLLAGQDTN